MVSMLTKVPPSVGRTELRERERRKSQSCRVSPFALPKKRLSSDSREVSLQNLSASTNIVRLSSVVVFPPCDTKRGEGEEKKVQRESLAMRLPTKEGTLSC